MGNRQFACAWIIPQEPGVVPVTAAQIVHYPSIAAMARGVSEALEPTPPGGANTEITRPPRLGFEETAGDGRRLREGDCRGRGDGDPERFHRGVLISGGRG